MGKLHERLTKRGVGAKERETIVRGAKAHLEAMIVSRTERIAGLEREICDLKAALIEVDHTSSSVEESKARRRALQRPKGATAAAGDAPCGQPAVTDDNADHVAFLRFSEMPVIRREDGLTWRTPLDPEALPVAEGPPFSTFINADVEVALRCSGAVHALYLTIKQRGDSEKQVERARGRMLSDERPVKSETCERVYDFDATRS